MSNAQEDAWGTTSIGEKGTPPVWQCIEKSVGMAMIKRYGKLGDGTWWENGQPRERRLQWEKGDPGVCMKR